MSLTEISLILLVALILFGPEDLPVVARAVGKIVYQGRKYLREISQEFQEVIDTPVEVIKNATQDAPQKTNNQKTEENEQSEKLLLYQESKDEAQNNSVEPEDGAEPETETDPKTQTQNLNTNSSANINST